QVFNRSQSGLYTYVLSWAIHQVFRSPNGSLYVFPAAILVACVGIAINYFTVGIAISLWHNHRLREVLRQLYLGKVPDFIFTLLAGAFLGAGLAALYYHIHWWALLAFAIPILLGRQVIARSQ